MRRGWLVIVALLALSAADPAAGAPTRHDSGFGCAWPMLLDEDALNVAFPDTSATYWMAHVPFVPGGRLIVHGRYPDARYFSLHVYDEAQRPVDSIADYQIRPDRAGTNPFAAPTRVPGSYTAYVDFGPRPRHPAPNTIYAGATQGGSPNPAGFVIYRLYIPTHADARTGGVPLPRVTLQLPGGNERIPLGRCDPVPPQGPGHAINERVRSSNYMKVGPQFFPVPGAQNPPHFERFFGTDQALWESAPQNPITPDKPFFRGGFLSNQQVAYLYARTSRQFGDVLVLRARAPSFPDTRAGQPVTEPRQVRYWSVCQNEGATQRVVACTPDYETPVRHGFLTVVISDPKDRPTNATKANGVAWLPWGGAYYDGIVIYRYMLPAPAFTHAIQNIGPNDGVRAVMGSYAPTSGYCSTARFERRGWRGCITK